MKLHHLFELDAAASTPLQRWFAGSQAIDAEGRPLKLYHGTSKDADFKRFNVPKNGVWFTVDPHSASQYAEQNDSQSYRWDAGEYVRTNTAARVIPVYLKMLHPKRVASMAALMPAELRYKDNYRRSLGIVFDKLRSEGYDGVIIADEVYVMLDSNAPDKIKSAIGSGFSDRRNIDERVLAEAGASTRTLDNAIIKLLQGYRDARTHHSRTCYNFVGSFLRTHPAYDDDPKTTIRFWGVKRDSVKTSSIFHGDAVMPLQEPSHFGQVIDDGRTLLVTTASEWDYRRYQLVVEYPWHDLKTNYIVM